MDGWGIAEVVFGGNFEFELRFFVGFDRFSRAARRDWFLQAEGPSVVLRSLISVELRCQAKNTPKSRSLLFLYSTSFFSRITSASVPGTLSPRQNTISQIQGMEMSMLFLSIYTAAWVQPVSAVIQISSACILAVLLALRMPKSISRKSFSPAKFTIVLLLLNSFVFVYLTSLLSLGIGTSHSFQVG